MTTSVSPEGDGFDLQMLPTPISLCRRFSPTNVSPSKISLKIYLYWSFQRRLHLIKMVQAAGRPPRLFWYRNAQPLAKTTDVSKERQHGARGRGSHQPGWVGRVLIESGGTGQQHTACPSRGPGAVK